jgi:hypothetical protein
LAPDQDWCLGCGAAATTRVLPPPSWKLAAATVVGVLAAVGVGVVLLVSSLSSKSTRATSTRAASAQAAPPPASTPPPAAAPAPAAPATGTSTTPAKTATSTTPAAPIGGGGVQTWPSGKRGWTVVLGTEVEQSAARSRAQGYIAKGVKAGVLDATKYTFSTPTGAFVIFFGQFDNQSAAVTSESGLADKLPATAYVTSVTPR